MESLLVELCFSNSKKFEERFEWDVTNPLTICLAKVNPVYKLVIINYK